MKPLLLIEGKTDDIDHATQMRAERRASNLMAGVKLDMRKLGADVSKRAAGKNVQWLLSFQAGKIIAAVKFGSERHVLGEFNVAAVADAKRRNEIVDAMKAEGILDAAEVADFRRRHPDKDRLAQLKAAMAAKLKAIETLKAEFVALKAEFAANGG
ncbi:MAG: hypothetical protein ACKVQR_11150 [Aquabacterium sp.]